MNLRFTLGFLFSVFENRRGGGLEGSWVVVSRVLSTQKRMEPVITIVLLLIAILTVSHEPPSAPLGGILVNGILSFWGMKRTPILGDPHAGFLLATYLLRILLLV